jgi:hypothetical protein
MQVGKWMKNVDLTTHAILGGARWQKRDKTQTETKHKQEEFHGKGKEEDVEKRKRPLSEAAGSAGKVQRGKGMVREGEGGGVVIKGDEKCPHNRQRSLCKECGGVGIYEHNHIRRTCKICCGVVEHLRAQPYKKQVQGIRRVGHL